MNLIYLIFLALTCACLVFGFLFGLVRGLKNSGIRLILVLVSAVGAVFLRGMLVGFVKKINIGGQTIGGAIESMLASGEFMDSISNIINELTDVLIGLVVYILTFYVLRFVTWLIIYLPIKLISKRRAKKKDVRIKKRRLLGGIVGIIQGVLCAFCVCAPLTGVAVQAQALSEISFTEGGNSKQVVEIPEKFDPSGYKDSFLGKIFDKTGKWYFTILTKAESGRTLEDSISAFTSVSKMAQEITAITEMVNDFNLSEGLTTESAEQLKKSFDMLQDISNSTSSESKQIIKDVLNDVAGNLAGEDFPVEIPDDFDFSSVNFNEIGEATVAIANINENGTASQEDVDAIVDALANNDLVVNALLSATEGNALLNDLDPSDKLKFETALAGVSGESEKLQNLQNLLFGNN